MPDELDGVTPSSEAPAEQSPEATTAAQAPEVKPEQEENVQPTAAQAPEVTPESSGDDKPEDPDMNNLKMWENRAKSAQKRVAELEKEVATKSQGKPSLDDVSEEARPVVDAILDAASEKAYAKFKAEQQKEEFNKDITSRVDSGKNQFKETFGREMTDDEMWGIHEWAKNQHKGYTIPFDVATQLFFKDKMLSKAKQDVLKAKVKDEAQKVEPVGKGDAPAKEDKTPSRGDYFSDRDRILAAME
jgi:hypothetical protein